MTATTTTWLVVLVASLGCYLLKVAGLSLPDAVLDHPRVRRVAGLLPVAMLTALVVVELLAGDEGSRFAVDWRVLVGMGVAVVALLLRRGVLTVFVAAVVTTAVLRALT